MYEQNINRPDQEVLMEMFPESRVISYKMPFSADLQIQKGAILPSAPQMNVQVTNPLLHVPMGQFSLIKAMKGEEDWNNIFNAMVDYTHEFFAHFRTLIRNDTADVYFLSYRYIDSLTHFYRPKMKKDLVRVIARELMDYMERMEIPTLFFSDHGGRRKTDVFRINKWLMEKGYLDVDIHLERWERQTKDDREVDEQIGPHSPFVQIQRGSKAISADAFDATVDTRKGCSEKEMKEIMDELESLKYFDKVYHKSDLYDEEGPHYDEIPDIIPQRAPGTLVTGNIHPKAGVTEEESDNNGSLRTGVHRRDAAIIGSNKDLELEKEKYKPTEVHRIIKQFIEEWKPEEREEKEKREVKDRLQRLGYI